MTASGLTRIPLTIVSTANGARTEGVLVGVMAEQLDALEAEVSRIRIALETIAAGDADWGIATEEFAQRMLDA